MTLWEKIKAFFKRLFGGKTTTEESSTPATTTVSTEIEVVVEDKKEEEAKPKIFASFDEDDKETLLNIIRPLIKGFNSDEFYLNVCKAIVDSRVLKTYASLSEDNMTLTIKLTQSKLFNEQIADFIADHVVSAFRSSIDAEFFGKYDVESDGGSIIIKKVD